jgi:iron complex outermembrane receptor protein
MVPMKHALRRAIPHHLRRKLGLFTLACLGPASGFAAQPAGEDLFLGEIPMVLTASRLVQTPYQAPAPVTVLDREQIEASGLTEIYELIRLVPGFLVADWAGGSPTIANHGLGDAYGRRVKVMIDGRTVNNPFRGNVDWQDLPVRVDDVERIEVLRGPGGAAYGANAFQGVINIITRYPGTEASNQLIARGGRNDYRDGGVRLNGGSGPLSWRATISSRRNDNFRQFEDNDIETIERQVANFAGALQIAGSDQLRWFVGLTRGYDLTGYPGDIGFPPRHRQIEENHLHASWQRSFTPESELIVRYSHQDRDERMGWAIALPAETFNIRQDLQARRDDLEFQFTHRPWPFLHALWGAGVRRDSVHSPHHLGSSDASGGTQWQTFASLTYTPIEALANNLGGTFEHHYYGGSLFSPRLAVNYSFGPFSALRMSTGTAYRAPTVQEADSRQIVRHQGDIVDVGEWSRFDLEPEKVRFIELGYVGRAPTLGLSLDARVFRERYEDYIDNQRCRYDTMNAARRCRWPEPSWLSQREDVFGRTDTLYFVNSGAVQVDGAEFRIDWRKEGFGRAILSQAFVDIDQVAANTDPDLELSSPTTMTTLLLIKELPHRWQASLAFYHADESYWLNDGDVVPTAGRTDLRVAKRFGPAGREGEVALTVQSLEGDYPEFHEGRYRRRTALFGTLRLGW